MTVRVVARIRPQQQSELEKDVILSTASSKDNPALDQPTFVKIPNPKNETESFSFQFSSVYDHLSTQQQIFDREVAPTIKHLFSGFNVTVFAYGSTGTGKTHTMRGGKQLGDRGIIPRLLSGIYRRARKIEKDSKGETTVGISLSYYEIYNDKVFDLLEPPEKRTLAGLPLRDNGGNTVVVGLTEQPCETLKEFEKLYDRANAHRSTSATKLNAVSSRSHAILGIKVALTTGDNVRISTASAIDLAGSEDNRRTENGKERMIESASINKSLFVLAKCVEAISSDSARIPYRESKMTRILSLGQNNGLTIMVLNLAPTRSYHLDTLSSLNFANRTKKIEVREIENEPIFKGYSRAVPKTLGDTIDRQPLRHLANTAHSNAMNLSKPRKQSDKQAKAFSVYSDKPKHPNPAIRAPGTDFVRRSSPCKRPSDSLPSSASHPAKRRSPQCRSTTAHTEMSKEAIEDIIEKKVDDWLAARALDQPSIAPQIDISEQVQRRLDLLEQKVEGQDDGREQGLTFLLMAKQHAVRGEHSSALRMYTLAKAYFPDNKKLNMKIETLQEKINERKMAARQLDTGTRGSEVEERPKPRKHPCEEDDEYQGEGAEEYHDDSNSGFRFKTKAKKAKPRPNHFSLIPEERELPQTPRTKQLLDIVNGRDISQIRLLKGIGAKKAQAIIEALCGGEDGVDEVRVVQNLEQLGQLRGVSSKTVDAMRSGL